MFQPLLPLPRSAMTTTRALIALLFCFLAGQQAAATPGISRIEPLERPEASKSRLCFGAAI